MEADGRAERRRRSARRKTGLLANKCAPDYSTGQCNAAAAERAWIVTDHMLRHRDGNEHPCTEEGQAMLATRDGKQQQAPTDSHGDDCGCDLCCDVAYMRERIEGLTAQRDKLAEALRDAIAGYTYVNADEMIDSLTDALAAVEEAP